MPKDPRTRPRFRLIRGAADAERQLGRVAVKAWRAGASPTPPLDAVVLEEDTWLALSAPPEVSVPTEHIVKVMTELQSWEPRDPGSLIVRPGRPALLLAVVYDFAEEPASRAEWVAEALARILDPGAARPLRRIAMPLLGTRHGGLEPRTFLALLRDACLGARETAVSEVCLQLDEGTSPDLLRALDDPGGGPPTS
jgi:hypothetical protein